MVDLTIITGTYNRPKHLLAMIHQVKYQDYRNPIEHIVVSDGPDYDAKNICREFGIRYMRCDPERIWGARPKDLGVTVASGRFVAFWDDDNVFFPFAISTLMAAVVNADVGIARVDNFCKRYSVKTSMPMPGWRADGLDYGCCIVRRELAQQCQFEIPGSVKRMAWFRKHKLTKTKRYRRFMHEQKFYDARWTKHVMALNPTIATSSITIGIHA